MFCGMNIGMVVANPRDYNKRNTQERHKMLIGKVIKNARTAKGLTLDQLSELTGVPQARLSRYENNCVKTYPLFSMAKIFDVLGVTEWEKIVREINEKEK